MLAPDTPFDHLDDSLPESVDRAEPFDSDRGSDGVGDGGSRIAVAGGPGLGSGDAAPQNAPADAAAANVSVGGTSPWPIGKANVLIVDDHALMRNGVANIINQEPDLQVIAEAADGQEAVALFERHRPDVTLMDLRMPGLEGAEAVRRIRARFPEAKVIILTTYDTDEDIALALKAGAMAFVLKDVSADQLVACIRDVLAGKIYLAPAAAAKLAAGVSRVQLTPRELSTLRLMADGKANKEIAGALGIGERTVKSHLGRLFEKLGVTSRTEAVKVAMRRGLVRLD